MTLRFATLCTFATAVAGACSTDLRDDADDDDASATMPASTDDGTPGDTTADDPSSSPTTTTSTTTDDGEVDSGDTSAGPIDDTTTGDDDGTTGDEWPWPVVDCAEGNDLVWVFDRDPLNLAQTRLQRFDPVAVELSPGPDVSCLGELAFFDEASLAVDRSGLAYVSGVFPDTLVRLPLLAEDPCAGLTMSPWEVELGLARMTFRSEDLFDPGKERLLVYVARMPGAGYGEIFHHEPDLPFALYGFSSVRESRLAGTGDGQLFGTGYDRTLQNVLIEHGAELPIMGSPFVEGFAIAPYDGAMYVFVDEGTDQREGEGGNRGIWRFMLDGSEAYELVVSFDDLPPLDLLDATSSTCAPTPFG